MEKKCTQAGLLEAMATGVYDGLVVRSGVKVTAEVLAAAGPRLKLVGRAGAGVDNVDLIAATKRGVLVLNTPGGNTAAAAELTVTLIANGARQIPAACADLKLGKWERKKYAGGVELRGKTVGVIGLGQIGAEVARRCAALDMIVIGFDPQVSEADAAAMGVKRVTLDGLYAASDFITLHTPLNAATKDLICAASLAKCKQGVYIVNVARGGVVNEVDLLAALESGRVSGAAIDVWPTEPVTAPSSLALIAHPKVIATPHLGASTEEAQIKVAHDIAEQMSNAFEGKPFVGCVNAGFLSLATKPSLEQYVKLATALGALQGQLLPTLSIKSTQIVVDLEGPVFGEGAESQMAMLFKSAVLRGLLPQIPALELNPGAVSLVSATNIAADVGLSVTVNTVGRAVSGAAYANTVRVSMQGKSQKVVEGSVVEKNPVVVRIDDWAEFPKLCVVGWWWWWWIHEVVAASLSPPPFPPPYSNPFDGEHLLLFNNVDGAFCHEGVLWRHSHVIGCRRPLTPPPSPPTFSSRHCVPRVRRPHRLQRQHCLPRRGAAAARQPRPVGYPDGPARDQGGGRAARGVGRYYQRPQRELCPGVRG